MNKVIRTVIVDDEELARRGLELRLRSHEDVEVIASCPNGREALQVVTRERPDLLLLDVQMPGLSGFQVAARLPRDELPLVVFVTAFDRYALEAFRAQALDYLLKPVDAERLAQALVRVRHELRQQASVARYESMLRLLGKVEGVSELDRQGLLGELQALAEPRYADVLPIRTETATHRLAVRDIDWIDAAGDYMCVHAQGRTYVMRETLKTLESLLDPGVFQRIHRSSIVNVRRVRELRPHMNGEYFLMLDGGQQLKLSRNYRDKLDKLTSSR